LRKKTTQISSKSTKAIIMDEIKLIQQIKEGNQQAFYQLVDLYKEKIFHTCYGILQNTDEAEDTTQEVFIEVFESIGSFNQKSKLSTWLYRIATNKSLDLLKYKSRKRRFGGLLKVFGLNYEADNAPHFHDKDPHDELENEERAQLLHWALAKLNENQHKAFVLHRYDDLSYAEIADIMQMTVPAIEALLHRSKLKLREILKYYYHDEK